MEMRQIQAIYNKMVAVNGDGAYEAFVDRYPELEGDLEVLLSGYVENDPTLRIPNENKERKKGERKKTKLDKAVELVRDNQDEERSVILQMLIDQLSMSKSGATTYYYKALSRINDEVADGQDQD